MMDRTDFSKMIMLQTCRLLFKCHVDDSFGSNDDLLLQISSCVVWQSSDLQLSHSLLYLLSFAFFLSNKP